MRDWALGSAEWCRWAFTRWGYGVESGLIYSFPCRCEGGDWSIVQGLDVNEFSQAKMAATEAELVEERDAVADLLPA